MWCSDFITWFIRCVSVFDVRHHFHMRYSNVSRTPVDFLGVCVMCVYAQFNSYTVYINALCTTVSLALSKRKSDKLNLFYAWAKDNIIENVIKEQQKDSPIHMNACYAGLIFAFYFDSMRSKVQWKYAYGTKSELFR